ncbi:50S ribosomal protein L18 [Mycoplasmoides gallisepticum]|uniref:Large ribosomal subunit protein uL18 n=2 Tax=Mycoplasmoides gallisepticum TaxID=2096 RepID=A0A5P3I7V1_MYCGL|nr:50S ribosomal protein L18 [Mycoplasmoides gallisepticum]AAB95403.1 ribosomal protein L18 [Mycoplasmoides gallisepticum]AHB99392.1 50S ribosomal protein L18 [Mycoplasmoides gallisepticum S6]OBU78207.1 50S ribosomal protein L18 [Mycoplasmoides gallisepticum]OBU79501.1 50S ribosomal protein L18 [Mycoplasmoides gallisepticum]OBU80570.1 50S ribosomal protein L18 [Mycoplasmoides gallisepticum]
MKQVNMNRNERRQMRHKRVIKKIRRIDNDRPVMIVVKSNSHISAQVWDFNQNKIIASSSSVSLDLVNGNKENAAIVGTDIANKLLKMKIDEITFDHGGSKYHGRIAALADAARKAGLKF